MATGLYRLQLQEDGQAGLWITGGVQGKRKRQAGFLDSTESSIDFLRTIPTIIMVFRQAHGLNAISLGNLLPLIKAATSGSHSITNFQ